jgi:hypothetical protein
VRKFPELSRRVFESFLERFTRPGTLLFRHNKWIGLNRSGKPFVVHVKHGSTRKYPLSLVEAVAKDLDVSVQEFRDWRGE